MSFTVKFAKELELFFQWTILNGYIICGDDKEQRLWDFKLIKDFEEPGRNKLEFYLKTLLKNECMIYFKGDKINDAKLLVKEFKSVPIEKSSKSSKSIKKGKEIMKEEKEIMKEIIEEYNCALKVDNCVDTSGGYFLCTLEFSTEQLVKILGEPIKSGEIDDEHVFEWRIVMNKEVFSIYDWENTVEFNKIVWHISGEKSSNVCNVKEWISKSLENVTDELEFDLSDIE